MLWGGISGAKCYVAKCHKVKCLGADYHEQVVHGVIALGEKCPWANCHGASCLWEELSVGQKVRGEMSMGQNVCGTNCPWG